MSQTHLKETSSKQIKFGRLLEFLPYINHKENGTGIKNENIEKLIARHEIEASLSDFLNISYNLLKDNGTLYMVHRTERLVDILAELRKSKLEPKKIKFVFANVKEAPKLVLIKAVKNAKPFPNGDYTKEILKIYNKL